MSDLREQARRLWLKMDLRLPFAMNEVMIAAILGEVAAEATDQRISELGSALRITRQMFGNLLARIHRDGGQYVEAHGWHLAAEDAQRRVVEWLALEQNTKAYEERIAGLKRATVDTANAWKREVDRLHERIADLEKQRDSLTNGMSERQMANALGVDDGRVRLRVLKALGAVIVFVAWIFCVIRLLIWGGM